MCPGGGRWHGGIWGPPCVWPEGWDPRGVLIRPQEGQWLTGRPFQASPQKHPGHDCATLCLCPVCSSRPCPSQGHSFLCRREGRGSAGQRDLPKATQPGRRPGTPRPAPARGQASSCERGAGGGPGVLRLHLEGFLGVPDAEPGRTAEPEARHRQAMSVYCQKLACAQRPGRGSPLQGRRQGQRGSVLPGWVGSSSSPPSAAVVDLGAPAASNTSSRAPSPATRHTFSPLAARISSTFLWERAAP